MNNDLISRSELKKAICDSGYSHYFEIFAIIDNAPTVEPEPVSEYQKRALAIVDALTEKHLINVRERGCLRRSILLEPERLQDESKTVSDCIIAYGDGFESARRLFESKCHDCDFRKFTETFINNIVEVMTKNGIESIEQLSEILGKGKEE